MINAIMNFAKRALLIQALINRPEEHNIRLDELQNESAKLANKQDWLWHLLLSSMSTMGNSRGYQGLVLNEQNYSLVSYNNLLIVDKDTRLLNLQVGLSKAKVRNYNRKAIWLNSNFNFIQDCGGLTVIQNLLLQTHGRESKLRIMKIFEGIGNKYARNIFMDMNHPDFLDSIAIDYRLMDISKELEIPDMSYIDHENIFSQIANEAGLMCWQLDRLLYNYKDYYLNAII